MINRRSAMAISLTSILGSACSAMGQMARPSFGVTVHYDSLQGATIKYGIEANSDSGSHLFGPSALPGGSGGGVSAFAGAGLPKWVRVTWRKPMRGSITATTGKVIETLDFGEIIGDYTIEVANRIPQDVQKYASQGKGRAIYLQFRIHDEGVLLAWAIEESLPGGGGRRYSMHGGDFKRRQTDINGKVVEKGWYIHPKTGQRIETDF